MHSMTWEWEKPARRHKFLGSFCGLKDGFVEHSKLFTFIYPKLLWLNTVILV